MQGEHRWVRSEGRRVDHAPKERRSEAEAYVKGSGGGGPVGGEGGRDTPKKKTVAPPPLQKCNWRASMKPTCTSSKTDEELTDWGKRMDTTRPKRTTGIRQ